MALKSGQMAGLDVPDRAMKMAQRYLESCCDPGNEGYAYVPGSGSAPAMTAVGLLCRQYLQAWGPSNPRLQKGISNHLLKAPPGSMNNMYYYYYATQVLHHFGGSAWKDWNVKMREALVKSQDKGETPGYEHQSGSWSPAGDQWCSHGGRVMMTSLCLLTLEVYYRHLPLYYREMGREDDAAVKKGL
jgi:hypothetical protein